MDEMENQTLHAEPEYMEQPPVPEPAESSVPLARENDVPWQIPAADMQTPPVRRRSPYENSPYMMSHQTGQQVPPVRTETPAPKKPGKKKKSRRLPWITAVCVWVLAVCLVIGAIAGLVQRRQYDLRIQSLEAQIDVLRDQLEARQNDQSGDSVSGTPNASPDGMTPAQVYAANLQSVVLIETDVATGSGFILTENGYVVTNYHVVEDGTSIRVVLCDGTYYDAGLIGYEANNDVALLKIEGAGFRAVTLGSSDDLIVGDQVAAIGNPLGELTSTLTVGYVSAKGRDVSIDSGTINMIQTDCAINSGNSGGPLFNMKGEVVGITTAKYSGLSASGASIEGIGFAVPVDDVLGILEDLMEFGYVKSGYLGVGVYPMDPGEAAMFNLPMGCLVDYVTPGSCADKAGVLPADIIIGLGGYTIEGYTDLARALRAFDGGETTTITVYRSGRELILSITLDAKPREDAALQPGDKTMPENGSYEEWYNYFFGE